jgi:uncharacterized phage protein (TIGR01671 family)
MSPIKFRAWDISDNVWLREDQFIIYPQGTFAAWLGADEPLDMDEVALMQYTGLKDKNGKEIYEGDIIEAYFYYDEDNDKKSPKNKKVFEVKYKVDAGRQFSGFDFFPSVFEYIEVIGNIYENPELVEATQ